MPIKQGKEGVKQEMHKFKQGELHSGSKHGPTVTNRKQAIAIALHQAGMSKNSKKESLESIKDEIKYILVEALLYENEMEDDNEGEDDVTARQKEKILRRMKVMKAMKDRQRDSKHYSGTDVERKPIRIFAALDRTHGGGKAYMEKGKQREVKPPTPPDQLTGLHSDEERSNLDNKVQAHQGAFDSLVSRLGGSTLMRKRQMAAKKAKMRAKGEVSGGLGGLLRRLQRR